MNSDFKAMSVSRFTNEAIVINQIKELKRDFDIKNYTKFIQILATNWKDIKFPIPLIHRILGNKIKTEEQLQRAVDYLVSHKHDDELNLQEFENIYKD